MRESSIETHVCKCHSSGRIRTAAGREQFAAIIRMPTRAHWREHTKGATQSAPVLGLTSANATLCFLRRLRHSELDLSISSKELCCRPHSHTAAAFRLYLSLVL